MAEAVEHGWGSGVLESYGSYARTKNPHRWFCSEEEAKAEGYRKSYI
jgi:hypothetical protein